jgi:hypothetical protein
LEALAATIETLKEMLKKVRQFFLDPYLGPVEKLLATLQLYGVKARLADTGRVEQQIDSIHWHSDYRWMLDFTRGHSLGLIDITDLQIRWVNVMEHKLETTTDLWYVYGIPDRDFPAVHIKPVVIRKSRLGKAIAFKWEGTDFSTGIIERLNQHPSINQILVESHRQRTDTFFEIDALPVYRCWTITTSSVPTRELWECYLTIANELLAVP